MSKTFKRLGALAAALALSVSMAGTAFAATSLTDGVAGTNAGTALDKIVTIEKELVVYNQDEATVAEPTITYTYALTAGSAGKQITDSDDVSVITKTGILPTTTTATVIYNNGNINADAVGASNKKSFTFDFSGVTYPAAGVYRYVVTETTDVAKTAAGITDGGISDVRYLDVYVRDARDGETGRQIYGYVLASYDNNIDGTADATDTVAKAVKTTGFVAATDADSATPLTADQYYTYNITVSKTLVNDSANNSHQFPFAVDFTNAAVTQNVLLKQTTTGNVTVTAPAAAAASSLDAAPSIAHQGSVKYIGIPAGTTVAVNETNNVTGTTYASQYALDGGIASTAKNIGWASSNNVSDVATLNTTADQADTTAHTAAFTNTFELISPTGVVLRYGPFIFMVAAGIALLVVSMRRRQED